MVALNKSTQILIDNFINTNWTNISPENRKKIKESVVEISEAILEQSNKDIDRLATKEDLLNVRSELKDEIANLKYDFLKWLVGSQVAAAGLIIAVLKFT